MAYYTALIAAWNNVTQPPPGVTGAALLGGDTTLQKIAKVNAWTITGSVPTSFFTTGDKILNCIVYSEFLLLTPAEQSNLLDMCAVPGLLLGGSSQTTHMVAGLIIDYFLTKHAGPGTIANLTALAQATVQPWWQAGGGLNGPLSVSDTTAAGLT